MSGRWLSIDCSNWFARHIIVATARRVRDCRIDVLTGNGTQLCQSMTRALFESRRSTWCVLWRACVEGEYSVGLSHDENAPKTSRWPAVTVPRTTSHLTVFLVTNCFTGGGPPQYNPVPPGHYRHWPRLKHFYVRPTVVACQITLFQNYISLCRSPFEIIVFQRVETCLKLFHRIIAAHEYYPTCPMSLR